MLNLDNRGNFMCCEEIENVEQAVLNNGFAKELYLKRVSILRRIKRS